MMEGDIENGGIKPSDRTNGALIPSFMTVIVGTLVAFAVGISKKIMYGGIYEHYKFITELEELLLSSEYKNSICNNFYKMQHENGNTHYNFYNAVFPKEYSSLPHEQPIKIVELYNNYADIYKRWNSQLEWKTLTSHEQDKKLVTARLYDLNKDIYKTLKLSCEDFTDNSGTISTTNEYGEAKLIGDTDVITE